MPRMFTGLDGRTKVFPDGTSDEVVAKVMGVPAGDLRRYGVGDSAKVAVREHLRSMPKGRSGYERATSVIPAVAGTAGSVAGSIAGAPVGAALGGLVGSLGGPAGTVAGAASGAAAGRRVGSTVGATVGGAGGEAIRQLATEIPALVSGGVPAYEAAGGPANPGEAAQRIAEVGMGQGALDAGGQVLGGAAKFLGKGAMMLALRANPQVAQTAIDYGIKFNRIGKQKLFSIIDKIGDRLKRVAAMAGARTRGGGLDASYIANRIEQEVRNELGKSSTLPADPAVENKLLELRREFIDANPRTLPLPLAHTYKQTAAKQAEASFIRLEGGQKMELPTDPVLKLWKLHESRVLSDALSTAIGPVYKELNARQSQLIALKNVIAPEVGSQQGAAAAVVRHGIPIASTVGGAIAGEELGRRHVTPGGPVVGALGGALAGSPQGMAMLSLALSHPALYAALRRGPQVGSGLEAVTR